MLEELFQYIWKMKLFEMSNLTTLDGEPVEIIQVGAHNHYSGPDFFNAKIKPPSQKRFTIVLGQAVLGRAGFLPLRCFSISILKS